MAASFDLAEELQAIQDLDTYSIRNEVDINSSNADNHLANAVESLVEASGSIVEQDVFDLCRSFLKHSSRVPGRVMNKLLDSLVSGLSAEATSAYSDMTSQDHEQVLMHKQPLEMYALLLTWFVTAAESVKGNSGDDEDEPVAKPRKGRGKAAAATKSKASTKKQGEAWSWVDSVVGVLEAINQVLRLQSIRIWTETVDRENFIKCITRPAYYVAESEQLLKPGNHREHVIKVICKAVKHHQHAPAAQINIMQGMTYFEHLADFYARLLTLLFKEWDHTGLTDEILREIGKSTFQENKGARTFSKFLIALSEDFPRATRKQLSVLMDQMDSEAYPIRIAMIEIIGSSIREYNLSYETETDGEEKTRSMDSIVQLFDALFERRLDLSSYVRTRLYGVFSRLSEMRSAFAKQRLKMARYAAGALEDKVASVRKAAIVLLGQLLKTHPYGIAHGGLLTRELFDGDYEETETKLKELTAQTTGSMEQVPEEEDGNEQGGDTEPEDEGEDDDGEEEDDDGEEIDVEMDEEEVDRRSQMKSKKKKKRSQEDGGVSMDVDEEGADDSMDVDDEAERKPKKKKKAQKLKPRPSQINVGAVLTEQAALTHLAANEILQLQLKLKYLKEALKFINQIELAMEQIEKLLGSTSKAEVLEAMEFYREASLYKIPKTEDGIRKMLHLIWSKNDSSVGEDGKELKGVKSKLLECYNDLFFSPIEDLDAKGQIKRIAKNMVERTYEASLADLTSLEEMMRIMEENKQVYPGVIKQLWNIYESPKQLPKPQRRAAIIVLGMLALASKDILTDHVDAMLRIGLGGPGKDDLVLARYTCVALQRLNGSQKKVKGSLENRNIRFSNDNPIFRRLQGIIEHPCRSRDWFGVAEQAINTIYSLAHQPDLLCEQMIKNLAIRAFTPKSATRKEEEKENDVMDDGQNADKEDDPDADAKSDDTVMQDAAENATPSTGPKDSGDMGDTFEMAQLLFVVGHVAIKHIVYLELVETEFKRRKDLNDSVVKKEKEKSKNRHGSPATSSKDGDDLDQMAGGNAEDEIGEQIHGIREHEMLYGERSLLAMFGPMLVYICGSPQKFKNPVLRAAAILSFSKFLCVSRQYCDLHHDLLFRLLESAKLANVRSNIVIALGDVAVSWSTVIDESSVDLYKGLADKNVFVKKNTLMVLTHLILNGMVKVKGQLGEMAKCLEDEEVRISDLAKLFFTELSTKDNMIYNNLPDIISHLSAGEHAVEEETFKKIMKYIFTFIEKEKQAESIVEKLCQRFSNAEDNRRQWRDIAFCMSMLSFKSERTVKKLVEGLPSYQDKLHEAVVFERFEEILNKARQNKSATKPDSDLDDFSKILEQHKAQNEDDAGVAKRASKLKKRAASRKGGAQPRKASTRASRRQPTVEEEGEEAE